MNTMKEVDLIALAKASQEYQRPNFFLLKFWQQKQSHGIKNSWSLSTQRFDAAQEPRAEP